jgi:hypothetical protein
VRSDRWILLGDMNMVELHNDSIGSSALLHGTKSRVWKRLVNHLDLLDLFLCAGICKGPVFTRQAMSGSRLDAARLDSVYTKNRDWFMWRVWFMTDNRLCQITGQ